MRDLFLNSEGCEQRFFRLRLVVFAPQSEEIEPALLGMSLTTLGEVPRPVSRFSRVAVARISNYSSFFNCVVRKLTVDQKRGSIWSTFSIKT